VTDLGTAGDAMAKRTSTFRKFANPAVAATFAGYSANVRRKLLTLRQLIFDTAAATQGVGELEETLRWGEPSYLTTQTRSGSMVRINAKGSGGRYAMYFHCQTNLVETFRERYADKFTFEKNRAIVFANGDTVPVKELRHCIALALTYHRDRSGHVKTRSGRRT
jgi:Domain of unknown function (DU1801)